MINENQMTIRGEFDLYLGTVKINDNQIIDIPPLRFKKYIEIEEYIPIFENFNKDSKKIIYLGPLEDYKKKK